MLQNLSHSAQIIARLVHPQRCPLCDTVLTPTQLLLCTLCYQTLPWKLEPANLAPTPLISAFTYESPIKQLILEGKNSSYLDKLQLLAKLLAHYFPAMIQDLPEAILPVPLHPKRLRQRGFNQSLELVRPLANKLGLPILLTEIRRQRHTDEQKKLAALARQHNLDQAFQLIRPIKYKHIAIFDDVVTTGATCAELEAILIDHGVEKVQIWCCAQTTMT
ncbi:comF family protein [Thiothrix eikelboomii]|uniref:ComF family protein n=1 Tax=Thiothrix eikelboomii TaxID=92487 RepID=A0A1T4VXA1_9GAMM|nr:ComF family protein [Thiothrix eikelboomii]SKA69640.1 comF family protein [Thiothrix eikelboomii]